MKGFPVANDPAPTMGQVINQAIDAFLSNVHTCLPGQVESYDAATGTANVRPLLKRKYRGEAVAVDLPVITNVPVIFPRLGNGWIRFPVNRGDYVALLFVERSIDTWFQRGGAVDPVDGRKFALADAVAIPGLNPGPNVIIPKGAATSVEVTLGDAWIEITAAGKFKVANPTAELMTELINLMDALIGGQVLDPTSGPLPFTPGTITQFNAIKTKINALKA